MKIYNFMISAIKFDCYNGGFIEAMAFYMEHAFCPK